MTKLLGWVLVVAGAFLLLTGAVGIQALVNAEGSEIAVAGITVAACFGAAYLAIKHGWRRTRTAQDVE